MSGGGGPVIEYVRGPMRIAMAPVASANPNDAGTGRQQRRGKKLRRWERGGFRSDGPRPDRFGGGAMVRTDGPPRQPPWAQGEGNGAPGERRRRRRRRKRRPGDGMQGADFQPSGNGVPGDAPVSFFAPAGGAPSSAALGPDGQPLRKRRRRRRRGRGGRQREWRTQGQGGDGGGDIGGGAPPSGGGAPPSGGGAPPSGGGVGSVSDGGGGSG
jgi:hypothetical protein